MRIRLIEGSDRRTHNLPTMEEITAVITVFIKTLDLSSTFNVSARRMLHTCVRIAIWASLWFVFLHFPLHCYFFNHCFWCLDDDSWPPCVIFVSLSHHFYKENYFEDHSKMCNVSKVERLLLPTFYY
ncbi:hypothetical protein AB4K20DRAFT_1879845 [Rhizopus microsporus]